MAKELDLKKFIRDIPDFPKKGIVFKDITPLLKDKNAFKASIDGLAKAFKDKKIDAVVAVESRGFIFGAALAHQLGVGFIPVRKKGKLPYKTKSVTYQLEYGTDTLEIHEDAVGPGVKVLIIDDVLATGGTLKGVADLLKVQKAEIVGVGFVIELGFLKGREKLAGLDVNALIRY
ncbi:MAG: adenine phosphoribosyltransferase [Candidatus Omnitrophica bacterium]|nr:adenine phosphoribosyltransferase [Candidatus Omnitrophota bacterium]